ncbi:hypothetical protein ACJX0J_031258, partial [Zea mays]
NISLEPKLPHNHLDGIVFYGMIASLHPFMVVPLSPKNLFFFPENIVAGAYGVILLALWLIKAPVDLCHSFEHCHINSNHFPQFSFGLLTFQDLWLLLSINHFLASKSTPEEIPLNVLNSRSWHIMLENMVAQFIQRHLINFLANSLAGTYFLGSVDASSEVENANMLADLWGKNMFTLLGSVVGGYWQDQGVQHFLRIDYKACLLFSLLQEGVQAENISYQQATI